MNEFSLLCRILGSLYLRAPNDPLLEPLFGLMAEGKLAQHWPLEQDELLDQLQTQSQDSGLAEDYQQLFQGEAAAVTPYGQQWPNGPQESQVREFLQQRGMPVTENPADHFGQLLLAASWLEDHRQADESEAQRQLFEQFIVPWCGQFLGKVEAHAATGFYRTLAIITRGALQAMLDELEEPLAAE